MGNLIGQILPFAVGVALSPVPIIAVILILFTPRARSNSVAFLTGWLLGLGISGGIALGLVGIVSGDNGRGSTYSGIIKLALGVLFLLLAIRNWRSRPEKGETAEMPKWMSVLDRFDAVKSLGVALLLSGINPKNLALTIAAATTIAASSLEIGSQIVTLLIYIVIGSVTVAAPVFFYLVKGEKAESGLNQVKDWLAIHNAAALAVLFLVFSAKLIGDGISLLSGS